MPKKTTKAIKGKGIKTKIAIGSAAAAYLALGILPHLLDRLQGSGKKKKCKK